MRHALLAVLLFLSCSRRTSSGSCQTEAECRTACEAGTAAACYQLGELSLASAQARTVAPDAFRRACALDFPKGCARVGLLASASPAELERARAQRSTLEQACSSSDAEACELAASLGADTAPHAIALRRASCEHGEAQACLKAAELLEGSSPADALPLYARGCSLKLAGACAALGLKYMRGLGVDADPEKAKEYLHQAAASSATDGGAP